MKVKPRCPVFGQCGGCVYQDFTYEDELKAKSDWIKNLLMENLSVPPEIIDPIVPSPMPYHYRHRLDLKIVKNRNDKILMGFSPQPGFGYGVVPVDSCAIAMESISEFLPQLKEDAGGRLTGRYRRANLCVRTGEDGHTSWGGIGRGSMRMSESEYLYTRVHGREIYYSLDTFFQANLSILPRVIETIHSMDILNQKTTLYDLYGGVGLFSICLFDQVQQCVLIEDNKSSVQLAHFNREKHNAENMTIVGGRVEDCLGECVNDDLSERKVMIIDPPRAGLSDMARRTIAGTTHVNSLLYLSCNPQALVRDLKDLTHCGWETVRIMPFDFFPKTKHLETLVLLESEE